MCHSEGILNGAAMETHSIFHSGSHSAPFRITAGEAQKKRVLRIYVLRTIM